MLQWPGMPWLVPVGSPAHLCGILLCAVLLVVAQRWCPAQSQHTAFLACRTLMGALRMGVGSGALHGFLAYTLPLPVTAYTHYSWHLTRDPLF